MSAIRPFRGIRARDDLAGAIIAPPYDTVSTEEARAIAGPNPKSFLHITRPEVDLGEDADPHAPAAYVKARENLDRFLANGWLVQDETPCFYLYAQTWRGRTQSGLMVAASVDEYDRDLIKKHELTRPDKEQDRVDHIEALDAQTGLVFLAYRDTPTVADAMERARRLPPAWVTTTDDGVTHALTVLDDQDLIDALVAAFAEVDALYVADGHHRSAAASRVAAARKGAGASAWFLAGLFPDAELEIMAYNRTVRTLQGRSPQQFRAALAERFDLTQGVAPVPSSRGVVTMFLEDTWWELRPKAGVVPHDPVGSLDVAVLQDNVLGPLLGIDNPRTDSNIDFVGGIRGHEALERAVRSGKAAVAFHMFPTGIDQLFAVADAGKLMPPKSTWFEPKLRGGVVVHHIG